MLRIRKRARALRTAVTKRRLRRMSAVAVRHYLRPVTIRVHDEAQPDIERVLERLVRLGVTIVDARPGTVTAQLISTYLDIKAKDLI